MALHRAPAAGALVACLAAALALGGCPDRRRGTGDEDFTPGQVIGAARAINVSQLELATIAKGRVAGPDLAELTDRMIRDHRAGLQSLEQVSVQLAIVGEESDLTRELQEDARAKADELAAEQGDELTDELLDAIVHTHRRALETIDDELMPSTSDPTLQQYLGELRGMVAAHLEMARTYEERERDEKRKGVPPAVEAAPR